MKVLIIDDGSNAHPLDPGVVESDDVWEATVATSTAGSNM